MGIESSMGFMKIAPVVSVSRIFNVLPVLANVSGTVAPPAKNLLGKASVKLAGEDIIEKAIKSNVQKLKCVANCCPVVVVQYLQLKRLVRVS